MKPDDVGLEMIDNILNNRCQKDSSEDEDEVKESRAFSNYVLRDISGDLGYKHYKTQQKIFEEREGLLSN